MCRLMEQYRFVLTDCTLSLILRKLPRSVLKDLLQFATKKSHFLFDSQCYDQIDGVAMGSPLGHALANILEKRDR